MEDTRFQLGDRVRSRTTTEYIKAGMIGTVQAGGFHDMLAKIVAEMRPLSGYAPQRPATGLAADEA